MFTVIECVNILCSSSNDFFAIRCSLIGIHDHCMSERYVILDLIRNSSVGCLKVLLDLSSSEKVINFTRSNGLSEPFFVEVFGVEGNDKLVMLLAAVLIVGKSQVNLSGSEICGSSATSFEMLVITLAKNSLTTDDSSASNSGSRKKKTCYLPHLLILSDSARRWSYPSTLVLRDLVIVIRLKLTPKKPESRTMNGKTLQKV